MKEFFVSFCTQERFVEAFWLTTIPRVGDLVNLKESDTPYHIELVIWDCANEKVKIIVRKGEKK